jgi:hypothetical protein
MQTHNNNAHRGLAMLLVLISMAIASIITVAYVASRDNSSIIGSNGASATSARLVALTGLDVAQAMLQTKADWRSNGGTLLQGLSVAGGSVDVELVDSLTLHQPDATTQYVDVYAIGHANGIQDTAIAKAYVPLTVTPTVDVSLAEFAAFVRTSLSMANTTVITRWPKSPLASSTERLSIGTRATSAGTIALNDTAAMIDTSVFAAPGASSSLITGSNGATVHKVVLSDPIPFPSSPSSNEAAVVVLPLPTALTHNGGTVNVNSSTRYTDATIKADAVRTLTGNLKMVVQGDLQINSGGKLVIDGNAKIVVFGTTIISSGAIELKPGATLSMFVRGGSGANSLKISDGYIGDLRTDSTRDNTGNASYMDPGRINIYSIPPSGGAQSWLIDGNSVIKGTLYAYDASSVTIKNTSALYGRIATTYLDMQGSAALFYDPQLNSRSGYTASNSPIFDSSNRIKATITSITSLDTSTLQTVADTLGVLVKGSASSGTTLTPSALAQTTEPTVGPSDPTPRPVTIDFKLVSVSSDVHSLEGSN